MDKNKIVEIFIPGPAGRLEAKYFKSKKNTSPIALVLQPHPQYGGTMNNKVVFSRSSRCGRHSGSATPRWRVDQRKTGRAVWKRFPACCRGRLPRARLHRHTFQSALPAGVKPGAE